MEYHFRKNIFDIVSGKFRAIIALSSIIILSYGAVSSVSAQTKKTKTPIKVAPKAAPVKLVQIVPLKTMTLVVPGSAVKIEMVQVPAGSITVKDKEGKLVKVDIKPYWIAKTETPWEAFDAFTISGPPSVAYDQTPFGPDAIARPSKSYIPPDMGWGHHGFPVIHESHINATMFCRWLADKTKQKYRLPTEAEWEYACRSGKAGDWSQSLAEMNAYSWTTSNSEKVTHPVGKKAPNAWGLYDMLGNVGEWCNDLSGNPVLCGGAYSDKPTIVKPGLRAYMVPAWQETDPQIPKSRWWLSDAHFAGFRIVCE